MYVKLVGAMFTLLFLMCVIHVRGENSIVKDPLVKLVVKFTDNLRHVVDKTMADYNFTFYRKITHDVYTYTHTRASDQEEKIDIQVLTQKLSDKTIYVYRSEDMDIGIPQHYLADASEKWPGVGSMNSLTFASALFGDDMKSDRNCTPVFDPMFGINDLWQKNITGKGVVIGIVDVGVDKDHPKLQNNIDVSLSWNYVDENDKFESEYIAEIPHLLLSTNHGISCAGLAAGREYTIGKCKSCGCGVAPDATIAVAKVGTVKRTTRMDSETVCRGLTGHRDAVDIFSNSFNLQKPFQDVSPCFHDVIKENYYQGRHCKGNIMLFAADPPGNGLVNNIYTIAVGDMGQGGKLPVDPHVNSAVLVSVFGSGKMKHSSSFVTDIHTRLVNSGRCCLHGQFGGQSAATAIVSGMIALVLQENPQLTARDDKHILIESASNKDISEEMAFKTNTAGYKYHDVLGFGYPNVATMEQLARQWQNLAALHSNRYACTDIGSFAEVHVTAGHINKTEQVEFSITFDTLGNVPMSMVAISPSHTRSVLFANITANKTRVSSTLLSNHFLGEDPSGTWQIHLLGQNETGHINLYGSSICALEMTIYGTGTSDGDHPATQPIATDDICNAPHADEQNPPVVNRSATSQNVTTFTMFTVVLVFKMTALLYGFISDISVAHRSII